MFKTIEEVEEFFKERQLEGIKPGLFRMEELLSYAGNPEKETRFIHVAGTNGKGSTIQFIKKGLITSNIKVGVFSSPSLEGLRGHIKINSSKIEERDFVEVLNKIFPKIKEMDHRGDSPTEFEIITSIAFIYFAQKVDLAIVEAGMGGAGDTTNCITPLLSVITNVSIDHKSFLGNTVSEIAREKAGIIKEETTVITGGLIKEALALVQERAELLGSAIISKDEDYFIENIKVNKDFTFYDLIYNQKKYRIKIKSKGLYQIFNSSLAFLVLIELKRLNYISLSLEDLIKGFSELEVPGRFEMVSQKPKVIVDGAHNVAAIKLFIETVKNQFKDEDLVIIFSAFKDKEVGQMLSMLQSNFRNIILTSFDHPRAISSEKLKHLCRAKGIDIKFQELEEIIRKLKNDPGNTRYFFTGSLHFVKNVKKHFN